MTAFESFNLAALALFALATWFGPRHFGVAGLVLVQVPLGVCYLALACVAIDLGRYEYDGPLSIIGLAPQAVVINVILLPIALVALGRRRRILRTR